MINHNKVFTPVLPTLQNDLFFQYRQNLKLLISEKLTQHQMAALGLYSRFFVVVNVINLLLVFSFVTLPFMSFIKGIYTSLDSSQFVVSEIVNMITSRHRLTFTIQAVALSQ